MRRRLVVRRRWWLGRRIGFGRAVGRELAKIVSALTFLIGYLMAAFTERKQALHDMIAGGEFQLVLVVEEAVEREGRIDLHRDRRGSPIGLSYST